MAKKPLIALPDTGSGLYHKYMIRKYETALFLAGAQVLWMKPGEVEKALRCDGLLLPGGDDIDPSFYGMERLDCCGKSDMQRDRDEWRLLESFFSTEKPFLGICRGEQMLNVFRGGTLHQDIKPLQQMKHVDLLRKNRGSHRVILEEGSRLREIYGCRELRVNTLHHQAADRIGKGLVVTARSTDGFVEALEDCSHPFRIAVQWHPEHMVRNGHRCLFEAFVESAK